MNLPVNGRCCGRKPLLYKRQTDARIAGPHYFCTRCDRAYSIITGEQLENWAWMWVHEHDAFIQRRGRSDAHVR